MLRLAGLPPRASDRTPHDPLVVIGGAVTFVNPEPLAPFADVIAAGEGEALVPSLVRGVRARAAIATICCGGSPRERGFYIPSFYDVRYADDGTIAALRAARRHRRAAGREESGGEDDRSARSAGDHHLHAGHRVRLALPDRSRARLRQPVPLLLGRLQLPAGPRVSDRAHPRARARGAPHSNRAGLVSIALCDHPEIERILERLLAMGYSISPASLRLDDLTDPSSAAAPERRADRSRSRLKPDPTACAASSTRRSPTTRSSTAPT